MVDVEGFEFFASILLLRWCLALDNGCYVMISNNADIRNSAGLQTTTSNCDWAIKITITVLSYRFLFNIPESFQAPH
jgi:hypothetical protein